MSLVAYGSSDESGGSDVEDGNVVDIVTKPKDPPKPSVSTAPASLIVDGSVNSDKFNSDLATPIASVDQISDSDSDENDRPSTSKDSDPRDLLKGLPAPKSSFKEVIEETDVLEDEVKPKPSQVSDIEKPAPKKSRQPVKITIPALQDSDDEDNEPVKKKHKPGPSGGKSGLFSLLPPPVHAAKKETNRILLPYSLTKKPPASNQAKSKPPAASRKVNQQPKSTKGTSSLESDSDDEEYEANSSSNFFSLEGSENMQRVQVVNKNSSLEASSKNEQFVGPSLPANVSVDSESLRLQAPPRVGALHLPAPTHSSTESTQNIPSSSQLDAPTHRQHPAGISQSSTSSSDQPAYAASMSADAPLTFKGGVTSRNALPSSDMVGPALPSDKQNYSNVAYGGGYYPEIDSVQAIQHDSEFLRLQGKKDRGLEDINIIDVNADDYTDPSEITKHLTEETTYQSTRKKEDQPSSQQRRKHQIGYLAFQAKERELELKNQWSQNRQTKKQTQAKYGF